MSELSWPVRRQLYQQASSQLDNEREITQVLADFRDRLQRRGRRKAAEAAHEVYRKVLDGKPLTLALGRNLSDLERSVLDSGEAAGQLADAMRLVIDVRERTARIRRKLQASFFAPTVYLLSLYAALFVIGSYVVPQFTAIAPVDRWTGWAYAMYVLGQLAVGWIGPVIFGTLAVVAGVSVWALPRWAGTGRVFLDRHVFPYTAYREVTGFAWLVSFAALLRAGVPDIDAIASQIKTASPWLASRLRPVHARVKNGMDLATALRASGHGFPSADLTDEIGAYVDFPDFAQKIEVVARQYADTLERDLMLKGAVLGGIFVGLMFVAFVVLQLGANSVSSVITSSVGSV